MIHSIVEARAEHLKFPHAIALGTKVVIEMSPDLAEWSGQSYYVANLSRDCDGTPLYDLHKDQGQAYKMRHLQKMKEALLNDEEMLTNFPESHKEMMDIVNQQIEIIRLSCEKHFSDDCFVAHQS